MPFMKALLFAGASALLSNLIAESQTRIRTIRSGSLIYTDVSSFLTANFGLAFLGARHKMRQYASLSQLLVANVLFGSPKDSFDARVHADA
jgi:hypothetical protein